MWYTSASAGYVDALSALRMFGDDRGERLDIVGRKLDAEEDGVWCFTVSRGPCGGGVGVGIFGVDFSFNRSIKSWRVNLVWRALCEGRAYSEGEVRNVQLSSDHDCLFV